MIEVTMPKWGVTMEEGTLQLWLKKVGDLIEVGAPLFVAETDKIDAEVESPGTGIVGEILVDEGMTVAPGTVLARIYSAEEWQGQKE